MYLKKGIMYKIILENENRRAPKIIKGPTISRTTRGEWSSSRRGGPAGDSCYHVIHIVRLPGAVIISKMTKLPRNGTRVTLRFSLRGGVGKKGQNRIYRWMSGMTVLPLGWGLTLIRDRTRGRRRSTCGGGGMALDPDDYFNPYPRALPRGTPKICSFFNTFVT